MTALLPTMIRKAGVLPAAPTVKASARVDHEALATEHWVFNKGNSGNLVGLKSGTLLTQVGSTAPAYAANSLSISTNSNNSLHSGVADQLAWSAFGVVKVPTAGGSSGLGRIVFTTYGGTAEGGVFAGLNGSTAMEMSSRAIIAGAVSQQGWNAANLSVGTWVFVGFAIDHTGSNRLRRFVIGPASRDFADSAAFTPSPSKFIAIGHTASDIAGGNEYAEFGVRSGVAFSLDQFAAIYARSKARMYRMSGITLL